MFTLKIENVKREMHLATQIPFLDVEVSVLNEKGKKIETRKFAFKLDTPEEEITLDLAKFLEVYTDDVERYASLKDQRELHEKADKTAESLKGMTFEIEAEENPAPKKQKKA